MSYIFSRALVEAYSEANCSASEPSAPSNSPPTPQAYCSPARMTDYSRLSRYGMTYAPLTDDRGAALLTWYLEASRARTFQPREKAPALTAPAPGSGGKCTELSMRYDRNSHSWKTHLCLWAEDLPESSVIFPKSGTMRNGLCWERTTWEPRTSGNASGYLHMIPTPTACNAPNKGSHSRGPKSLMDVASTGWMPGMMWPTATTRGLDGGSNSRKALLKKGVWIGTPTASGKKRSEKFREGNKLPNPHEFVEMFPSPLASDHKRRGPNSRQQGLSEFVRMFPTPTASCGGKESNRKTGKKLITVVSQFPTPRTQGMCGGTGSFQKMKDLEAKGIITPDERRQMTAGNGGQLNPTWVEWLMGWPLEWTALKPLAMGKYLLWRQLHSGFCSADSKKERRNYEHESTP